MPSLLPSGTLFSTRRPDCIYLFRRAEALRDEGAEAVGKVRHKEISVLLPFSKKSPWTVRIPILIG